MFKRIRGTLISWLASKTFKRISAVIVAALALVLFFCSGAKVFADEFVNISVSGAIYSYQVINSGVNGSINVGTDNYVSYIDYTLIVGDQFTVGSHPEDGRCYGYYQSRDVFNLSLGISSNTNTVSKNVEYLGFTPLEADYDYTDLSSYSVSSGGSNNFANITFYRNTIRYINDRTIRSGPNYVSGSYKFRVYFVSSEGKLGLLGSAGVTRSDGQGFTGTMKYAPSGNDYLYSIDQQQSITNNLLNIDNSGTSNNMNTINNAYDSAQAAADTAVDGAVHDYSNELDTVENMDFSSFFDTQRYSLNFWRSVGEFILDSSNLGYIATGLIVVTVINLFVFMLRL